MKVALYWYVKVSKLVFSERNGVIKEKVFGEKKIEKIPYENSNIVLEEDIELKSVLINGNRYRILEKILDTGTYCKGYLIDYIIRTDFIELDEQTKNCLLETEIIVNNLKKQFPLIRRDYLAKIAISISGYNGEVIDNSFIIYYEDLLKTENIKSGIVEFLKKIDVENTETLDKIKELHDILDDTSIQKEAINVYINIITHLFLKRSSSYSEWKTSLISKRTTKIFVKYVNIIFANSSISHDWNIFNMTTLVKFTLRKDLWNDSINRYNFTKEPLIGMKKDLYNVLSNEVKTKKIALSSSDIEGVKQISRELYGDKSGSLLGKIIPLDKNIVKFLMSYGGDTGAIEIYKEWTSCLELAYGKRKFEEINIKESDVY